MYVCEKPTGLWCIYGPCCHSSTALPRTAVAPLSIIRGLLTGSCDGNSSRARFKINSPKENLLCFLAIGTASLEVLKLGYLDRRHLVPSEHPPWRNRGSFRPGPLCWPSQDSGWGSSPAYHDDRSWGPLRPMTTVEFPLP
jgi:hypothetical protein